MPPRITIRRSIILDDLRQIGNLQSGEPKEIREGPALELSTHTFRPVVASEILSVLSLTPLWRLGAGIINGLLCLTLFYPWSDKAMADFFTGVSHPWVVVCFFVCVAMVRLSSNKREEGRKEEREAREGVKGRERGREGGTDGVSL
jgi:hypothetical protein